MCDEWKEVKSHKSSVGQRSQRQKKQKTPAEIRNFLATYKTNRCTADAWHEWFTCACYHINNDQRRDPYREPYEPVDAMNKVEKAYHPRNFKTLFCHRLESTGKCDFGNVCAFAHDDDELRSGEDYDNDIAPAAPPLTLNNFGVKISRSPTAAAVPAVICGWEEPPQPPDISTVLISLNACQRFAVARSRTLWSQLHDDARGRMCDLERYTAQAGGKVSLRLKGVTAKDAVLGFRVAFEAAVRRSVLTKKKSYSVRVLEIIERRVAADGPRALVSAPSAHLEVNLEDATLAVTVVRESPLSAQILAGAFDRVDFFVCEARYDEVVTCAACLDEELNLDQGAQCPRGHFFCSEGADGGCFDLMLREQRERLRAQDACLLCPVCNESIPMQTVAASVSKETWDVLERDIVDSKVSAATVHLKSEFDERLQKNLDELFKAYATDEGRLTHDAKRGAACARNEALNLRCPHCKIVYAEFEGCMALQCTHCRKHFCAYCHKGCESSRGAHLHVRECDMNLTRDGSYYANPEEIEDGQRRYRIKELKKFLRSNFKKNVQNAVLIELKSELADLKIDPAALFDFGILAEV